MTFTGVDNLYWAAGFAGHLSLLTILGIRHHARRFPTFTSLVAFNLIRTIALRLVLTYAPDGGYFYTYWPLFAVDITLQLLVIYEIAGKVFRPLGYWAPDVRSEGIRWVLASLVIAMLLTWLPKPAVETWYETWILKSSFFTSALECELLVGIALISWEGGFPWRSNVARIAFGFVIFAFPDMMVEIATTRLGVKDTESIYYSLIHCRMTAYLTSLLFWNVTLWMKGDEPRALSGPMTEQVESIHASLAAGIRSLQSEGKAR